MTESGAISCHYFQNTDTTKWFFFLLAGVFGGPKKMGTWSPSNLDGDYYSLFFLLEKNIIE